MDDRTLFMWMALAAIIVVIICVTAFSLIEAPLQTPEERATLACDWACPHESEYCIVECVKTLNIDLNCEVKT